MNSSFVKSLSVLFVFAVMLGCKQKRVINFPETDLNSENFIPKPLKVVSSNSGFALDQYTVIQTSESTEFKDLGEFIADKIKSKTGLDLPVNGDDSDAESIIVINQNDRFESSGIESYQLRITSDTVLLSANGAAGAFRGLQTFRQIIPDFSNDTLAENSIWVVPSGEITDHAQFEYRGAMLDVARHFFSVEEVKKYIDLLAYYKYNALHLHLADDQGWRIEIKSWPKLVEIGGSTEVGGGSGGFYSQEEYADIVNYAAGHHMMIVPEIDMPGHTNAASVSYPFLNGNGKSLELYTGTKVGFSTFDTRKDSVYAFIDDVVREIAALSPGAFFHIGGDESHVTEKDDYIYFVNRVEKIVKKYGKRMIGWDEVANAGLDSTSISQFWRSKENAQAAAEKRMKIILSPGKKAYLDMKYDAQSKHGLTWAGFIPVDTAYIWSPESYADVSFENILGIEAPLWSETISNSSELEYLAFPRAIGYAELGWTLEKDRNWEDYKVRLANQVPFLNRKNVNYYPSPLVDWSIKKDSLEN